MTLAFSSVKNLEQFSLAELQLCIQLNIYSQYLQLQYNMKNIDYYT